MAGTLKKKRHKRVPCSHDFSSFSSKQTARPKDLSVADRLAAWCEQGRLHATSRFLLSFLEKCELMGAAWKESL